MPNPTDIRLAIAAQPTVEQSVDALTRAVTARINQPVTDTGPDSAHALAVNMQDEPKAWSDAVLANTPMALQSATMVLPLPIDEGSDPKACVAAQPSVAQAVTAFLRHVSGAMLAQADGHPDDAHALVADISADPRSWTDAILANTMMVPSSVDLAPMPPHLAPLMGTPGVEVPTETVPDDEPKPELTKAEAKAEAKAQKAEADSQAKIWNEPGNAPPHNE